MRYDGVINNPAVLPKTKRWLADAGANFTQAFTTTPLCCPDRATMWSGRLEHNHGVVDNYAGDNLDHDWISPRYLHDAGYRTSLVGKFITDWNWRYEPPHFDDLAVFQGGYTEPRFMVKGPGDAKAHSERSTGYSTEWIGGRAASLIDGFEAKDDQPWFMQVSPHAPHQEQTAPGPDSCNLQKMYTWPAKYDSQPIPPWKPTPAEEIEGGPNGKAEKQDKAQFVRSQNFSHKCGQVTYDGAMKTLMVADDMVDTIMTRLQTDRGAGQHAGALHHRQRLLVERAGHDQQGRAVDGARPGAAAGPVGRRLPARHHRRAPRRHRGLPADVPRRRRLHAARDPATPSTAVRSSPDGRRGTRSTWSSGRCSSRRRRATRVTGASRRGPRCGRSSGSTSSSTSGTTISRLQWQEYYDLAADPWELNNLLADKDPSNDPDVGALSARLHKAAVCAGTAGANPCP